jgi:hypothetical protein
MLHPFSERSPPLPSDEISAAALLAELAPCSEKALIFRYEGRDVLPGYHVTEVKSGAFKCLTAAQTSRIGMRLSFNFGTWP